MIKRKSTYPVQQKEKMRGGEGTVIIEELLTPAQLYDKGRLYAKMTLSPGSSIGSHIHENEMESFYILSGEAEFCDDGEIVTLRPGDSALTPSGGSHFIKSIGDIDLEMIALILFK